MFFLAFLLMLLSFLYRFNANMVTSQLQSQLFKENRFNEMALSRIVFLPGAYHGSWCYKFVIPYICNMNYEYVLIDYPRRNTPNSISEYVDHTSNVIKHISIIQPPLPLFIVAHSMGGLIGCNAAEICHKFVSGVVLIAGAIPNNGYLETGNVQNIDQLATKSDTQGNVERMYSDCSMEQIKWVKSQLVSEYLYGGYVAKWSKNGFGSTPKLYVKTKKDEIIKESKQREICDILELTIENGGIVEMDTSHSPFLSQPMELAGNINKFINKVITAQQR